VNGGGNRHGNGDFGVPRRRRVTGDGVRPERGDERVLVAHREVEMNVRRRIVCPEPPELEALERRGEGGAESVDSLAGVEPPAGRAEPRSASCS
jgi:hypothetical protein